MHHNDFDADQVEQHKVVDNRILELLVDHGVAAVLDDDGLSVIFLYKRQGFHQNFGFQRCIQLCIHTIRPFYVK